MPVYIYIYVYIEFVFVAFKGYYKFCSCIHIKEVFCVNVCIHMSEICVYMITARKAESFSVYSEIHIYRCTNIFPSHMYTYIYIFRSQTNT